MGNLCSAWVFGYFSSALDAWSKIATIVGGASIIFVVKTFLYQQEADKAVHIIEMLKFFRSDLIFKSREMVPLAIKIDSSYISARPRPEAIFDLEEYKKLNPTEATLQKKLHIHIDYQNEEMTLLNMLEEFALEVIYTDSIRHPALASLKSIFTSLIEKHIVTLLELSSVPGNGNYPGITILYKEWKNK